MQIDIYCMKLKGQATKTQSGNHRLLLCWL